MHYRKKRIFFSAKSITPKIFRVHFESEINKPLAAWSSGRVGVASTLSGDVVGLNSLWGNCDWCGRISHQLIPTKCALTEHKNCTWWGWFSWLGAGLQVGVAGAERETAAVTIQVTIVNANEFYTWNTQKQGAIASPLPTPGPAATPLCHSTPLPPSSTTPLIWNEMECLIRKMFCIALNFIFTPAGA